MVDVAELLDTSNKIPRTLKPAQELRRNEVLGYLQSTRSQKLMAEKLAQVNLEISECGTKILHKPSGDELSYEDAVRYVQVQTGWELR